MVLEGRAGEDAKRIVALVALAALALGTLWTLQAATAVDRVERTVTRDAWAEEATLVAEPLRVDGTPLAGGEPGYFTSDAPTARLTHTWSLRDEEAERLTAIGRLALVVRHDATPGRPAWTHEEVLATGTLAGDALQPLVLVGTLDLPASDARIRETPGRDPSDATWQLVATVRFASAPEEGHAADASAFVYPLSYSPPLYVLPDADDSAHVKDHAARESVVEESPRGFAGLRAAPAGPILLLAAVAGLAYVLPRVRWLREGAHEEEAAP